MRFDALFVVWYRSCSWQTGLLRLSLQRESYMLYLTRKLVGREPNNAAVEIGTQAVFYTVTLLPLALTVLA